MKHGLPFIAEMYREGRNDEDVVMTYKRLNNLTQKQFCDEMFDANCHIVNFDYPGRGRKHARMPVRYLPISFSMLTVGLK